MAKAVLTPGQQQLFDDQYQPAVPPPPRRVKPFSYSYKPEYKPDDIVRACRKCGNLAHASMSQCYDTDCYGMVVEMTFAQQQVLAGVSK